MIPQEFYKLYKQRCSLYITDFNTEVYDLTSQASSYRIDINAIENYSNYTYHYKIFGLDGKLLTINEWTLKKAYFHKAWNVNYSPLVTLTDPQGICLKDYRLTKPFSHKEDKNIGGLIENRLRETFEFIQYISQFQNLYDFKTIHDAPLSNIDDAIRFYLETLKIKDRLPQKALSYITDSLKREFESYLQKKEELILNSATLL